MSKKEENKKEMSIADYKVAIVKVFWKWVAVVTFLLGIVVGMSLSYFHAVNVVTSTQHEAIKVFSKIDQ